MDYCTFVNAITKKIKEEVSDDTVIQKHTVIKNNGKKRIGLVFHSPGVNISPAIYLEEYYEKYQDGAELHALAENIISFYEKVRFRRDFDEKAINDFDTIKPRIVFQLVNYWKNAKRLQDMPYLMFHDLAICFYVLLEAKEQGVLTFTIDNSHLRLWGVNLQTIAGYAMENTPKLLEASFGGIDEVISELQKSLTGISSDGIEEEECQAGMFILTNQLKNRGASVILYPHILEMIGEILKNDFYILPSSIHEVIILPTNFGIEKAELECIVEEINETQLEEEEILSNHVYFFDRKSKRILY